MTKTVLCFGDSNTHGTLPMTHPNDRKRLGPDERWPGVLARSLGSGFAVQEEGLPGRTTTHPDPIEGEHLNGRIGLTIALATHRPVDLVAIMLGTNDLKARFSVTSADIATSIERLSQIVRLSDCGPGGTAPDLLIVAPPEILEVDFLGDKFVGGAEKSQGLGRQISIMAERNSLRFLNANDIIRSSPVDGIHFGAEDHKRLGEAIAAAIKDWDKTSTSEAG